MYILWRGGIKAQLLGSMEIPVAGSHSEAILLTHCTCHNILGKNLCHFSWCIGWYRKEIYRKENLYLLRQPVSCANPSFMKAGLGMSAGNMFRSSSEFLAIVELRAMRVSCLDRTQAVNFLIPNLYYQSQHVLVGSRVSVNRQIGTPNIGLQHQLWHTQSYSLKSV
jgi:hypothetical protein